MIGKTMEPGESISLRPTEPDDLDEVMALEHHPANIGTIMPWSREEHLAAMADADARHCVVQAGDDPRPAGLVILRECIAGGQVELKRIVIRDKDQGHGRAVLGLVEDLVFNELGAESLRLDVMDHNARGMHLYESVGYKLTGDPPREFIKNGRPARFLQMVKRALG